MDRNVLSIVIGCTSKVWGGNEKWALDAASALLGRGHRVTVFWTHDAVGHELASRRIPARRIRLRGDIDVAGLLSLVRLIRSVRADVVLLTKQREYWLGGLASRLARRPLVALRLGTERRQKDDFKRRLAFGRLADVVIVPAEGARRAIEGFPWFEPGTIRVVRTGVSTDRVDAAESLRVLRELGIPPGVPIVCGVGRLGRVKGFDLLLEAFAEVLRAFPTSRLLIVGEGAERDALAAAVEDRGMGESVVLAGHCDRVRAILAGVDVYVLSSRYEGMANTLLEAMSVGAPIVATDVSGTREAVRDGVDALVVPPEDPSALADAILRLLCDREFAKALGRSALERAGERFSRERMADELEEALRAWRRGEAGDGRDR